MDKKDNCRIERPTEKRMWSAVKKKRAFSQTPTSETVRRLVRGVRGCTVGSFGKKAKIDILSARDTTRPGFQAGALWVESKGYVYFFLLVFQLIFTVQS